VNERFVGFGLLSPSAPKKADTKKGRDDRQAKKNSPASRKDEGTAGEVADYKKEKNVKGAPSTASS